MLLLQMIFILMKVMWLENIKDQKTNVINNNLKEEKNDEKILKNKNKRKSKVINEQNNNDKNE